MIQVRKRNPDVPKCKYTSGHSSNTDSQKYNLNGWSYAGVQRINALTREVLQDRRQYSKSFDARISKFVSKVKNQNKGRTKKRKTPGAQVLTVFSDLEVDFINASLPNNNPAEHADPDNQLLEIDDELEYNDGTATVATTAIWL